MNKTEQKSRMRTAHRLSFGWLLIGCLTVLVGCGEPDYYLCNGVVTLNDKPIDQLQITFEPDVIGGRPPIGVTDAKGYFEMTSGSEYGVPPGTYKIFIEDPAAADGRKTSTEPDYLYVVNNYGPRKSDLTYEATSHQQNYEIKLTK